MNDTDETFQRQYYVTLRFPQTVTFNKDGLEQWLEVSSPPFKQLIAKNMVEDWECFWDDSGEHAEDVAAELVRHMTGIEEAD